MVPYRPDVPNDMTHTLKMTNTSKFNLEELNTRTSQQRLRATSFDLILFRIPNLILPPHNYGMKELVMILLT